MRSIFTAIITFALLALFAGCGDQAEPADSADSTAIVVDSATIYTHEVRPDSVRPARPEGERPERPERPTDVTETPGTTTTTTTTTTTDAPETPPTT